MNYKKYLIPVLIFILSTGFVNSDSDIYYRISKSIDVFGKVYKEVTINYVDNVNPEEFMESGIRGMLEKLDPYTVFIDEENQKDIEIIATGKYGGIGVTVGLRNDDVTIVDLIEGYSAQRQGIRIGDVIEKVDGVELTRDNYEKLSTLMKGEPGTFVNLLIEREGLAKKLEFNLVREEIQIKNLSYYGFIPENSGNVYLKLSGFSQTAGEEVKDALLELEQKGEINSIVLDLRNNPGGLLGAAVDVTEKFLAKDQTIVKVIGRDSIDITEYTSKEEPIAGEKNLVVLVNGGSASASEIVAGALQDHDRAVIVGSRSFGKGLVQTVIPLSYKTSVKITTAKYYTPSGRSIQKIDYSTDNDVIEIDNSLIDDVYFTDNNRKVYAKGGILPDSVVESKDDYSIVKSLLAQGVYFQFASFYYNSNPGLNIENLDKNKTLDEFKNYLVKENFQFNSETENTINKLKQTALKEKAGNEFLQKIDDLEEYYLNNKFEELDKYSEDISAEIIEELSSRIGGRKLRISKALENDDQFNAALKILNTPALYSKLLSSGV